MEDVPSTLRARPFKMTDGWVGRAESLFCQAYFGGCSINGGSTEHEGAGGVVTCSANILLLLLRPMRSSNAIS